ncbi:hypothetical protein IAU59_005811 [Kwoniella sp. CBS 9459]
MYFDLYFPFAIPEVDESLNNKKSKKGKGKAGAITPAGTSSTSAPASNAPSASGSKDCWAGLESREKNGIARRAALLGHLGYSVVGCTINPGEPSNQVHPSPFQSTLPFPVLDPRKWSTASTSTATSSASASASSSASYSKGSSISQQSPSKGGRPPLVQITRYHMRLDDNRVHPLTGANTNALRNYDILSVSPTSEKAFQLACTDMSNPGPNQISIITLPLHERPFTFRFNRKQMKQAQRNGVVFELLYSAALFPSPALSPVTAKRYRQNFLSNAREVVRITGGKGVIFSSGPGANANENGFRGPLDLVNLGTMIGMPSNLAKEAVSDAPRAVLLRAQARRTFKAVMSTVKIIPPPPPSSESSLPASQMQNSNANPNPNPNTKTKTTTSSVNPSTAASASLREGAGEGDDEEETISTTDTKMCLEVVSPDRQEQKKRPSDTANLIGGGEDSTQLSLGLGEKQKKKKLAAKA